MPFPPGFRWGAATSGHQTEGGNTNSGLHEVDRETFVRTPKPSAAVYSEFVRAHAAGAG